MENDNGLSSLRQHQLKAVEALKELDVICKENGIHYFLEAGSCLGAIRHKGFIPWDDDIDVDMDLANFNKFRKIIKEKKGLKYIWKHTDVDLNFPSLTGKFLDKEEPLITVFPLVKLSDNRLKAKTQWWIRKVISPVYQRKVHYPLEKINMVQIFSLIVSGFLSCFFSKRKVLEILRWNEQRYEHLDTEYSINIYSKYSMKRESIRNEWLKDFALTEFEGGQYPIIKNYHAYLTHLYGDYMTPPPQSQRNAEHLEIVANRKK